MLEPVYIYRASVSKVVDAGTLDLQVEVGFHITFAVCIQLEGVIVPEPTTKEGKVARDYVRALLPPGTEVVVETSKDVLKGWMGRVWFKSACLNDHLLDMGFAAPLT